MSRAREACEAPRLSLGANGSGVKIFFLTCVFVAGVYGSLTASRKILFIQAVPAAVGLVLIAVTRLG